MSESMGKRSREHSGSDFSPKKKRMLESMLTSPAAAVPASQPPEILSPSYKSDSLQSPEWNKPPQSHPSSGDWPGEGDTNGTAAENHLVKVEQSGSKEGSSGFSDSALNIMKSMGFKPGSGLGKDSQGITAPILASTQKGNRGLGHYTEGFQSTEDEWKERPVSTQVTAEWMSKPKTEWDESFFKSSDISQLVGARKETIEDETKYVSREILEGVLKAKTIFDQLPEKELRDARTRANPFESIASVIFQNRAAMKMAEIDALSSFAFSQKHRTPDHVLYFADICAGPGGFSEYILWRAQWHAKGFGLTLKDAPNASDFKLFKFLAGPMECFEPYYGAGGQDGDGDITKPENLEAFRDYVVEQSGGGLHFVMGDGGISVEGQENIQEILTKQLLLCQFACALSVLKQDGHFVCKTFDLYTPFSVSLVHLLRYAFEKVAIIKPLTSRPANSERYVLCMGCKSKVAAVLYKYLFKLNEEIHFLRNTDRDVQHCVPEAHYTGDTEFCRYLTRSNDTIGENQLHNLQKLRAYVRNTDLRVSNQNEIREICLRRWEIPNETRKKRQRESPQETAVRLLSPSLFKGSPSYLNSENVGTFSSKYSWKCHLNYGKPVLLLAQGGRAVWVFSAEQQCWVKDQRVQLELPKDTIVEAQVAEVFQGESGGMRTHCVVLTDGIVIGGQDVYQKPYSERQILLEKLCQTVRKESYKRWQEIVPVRPVRVENFYSMTSSLVVQHVKGHSAPRLAHCVKDRKMLVNGMMLIRHIKEPWNMELSSKLKKFYFFNAKTRESQYQWPAEAAADFGYTRTSSLIWPWEQPLWTQILQREPVSDKLLESFLARVQPVKQKQP